ncbi:MAG: putative nicotinate-nucleotide pyrophosphorylase [carboxylating] [Calditrichaeota bacterium]|nr:putative nicotinate-nucleotide pyrophosphorylase [carboxylating] [Calditrichota bacterium]
MSLAEAAGPEWLRRHVKEALAEDLGGRGDITSLATIGERVHGRAELIVKGDGVIAGIDWAIETGRRADPPVDWEFSVRDGDPVTAGQVVARVTGSVRGILLSERTALNGLGRLSGIATFARRAMERVRGTGAVVIDTRKTTPGWRLAEKWAVHCGGAENHRVGLYDEMLIKENHIEAAGGVAEAIRAAREWVRANAREAVPIEVEVETLDQLSEALTERPDRILLDNFPLDRMLEAVAINDGRCVLEASGGITLDTLADVAGTGVDRISLGALTHSAKPLDLSLRMRKTYQGALKK